MLGSDAIGRFAIAQLPPAPPGAAAQTRPPHITKLFVRSLSPVTQQAYNLNLYGGTVASLPFNQVDWSKPMRVPHAPYDLSIQLNQNLFTNQFPFSQSYSISQFFDRAISSPDQIYNPNLYSVVVLTNPFNQTDFSVGRFPRAPVFSDQSLNPNIFTNPVPFNQVDWNKPLRSPRTAQPPDTLNLNIFTNPIPFNQVDWSRPIRVSRVALDQQPLNLNLFSFVVVQVPFNQTDWSKPFRMPLAPFATSPPLNLNMFTNPIPFMVTDRLPNKRLPLAMPQPPLPLNLNLFKNPIPFNQVDWAKPLRIRGYPNHTLPLNINLILSKITYVASLSVVEHGDFFLAVLYQFNPPLSAYVDIIENDPLHRGNLGIIVPIAQSSIIASISEPTTVPATGVPVAVVAGARVAIII